MKLKKFGIFKAKKEEQVLNICFFVNTFGSSLIIPLIVFYAMNGYVSQSEVELLGSIKFWLLPLFSLLSLFLIIEKNILKYIVAGLILKGFAFVLFFIKQDFSFLVPVLILNAFGGILFSTASSLYIKEISDDVAYSFSLRFTIANIAAAVSPIFVIAIEYISNGFYIIVASVIILYIITALTFKIISNNSHKISLNEPIKEEKISNNQNDKKLHRIILFTALSSMIFSIFYYFFEIKMPIYLNNYNKNELFPYLVALNTIIIIFGQIKIYKKITKIFNEFLSLIIAFFVCFLLFLPFFIYENYSVFGLICLVLGITFVEIFYSTCLDVIIVNNVSKKMAKYLLNLANVFIAIGATIAGFMSSSNIMHILLLLLVIYALIYAPRKIKNK